MAKSASKVAPKSAPKASRTRAAAYKPESKITIVEGEGQRRVVKNLTCDRALQAMKANPTVGKFVSTFGAACDKAPLPGRAGQPGTTQASAILRYLEREGAVTVK